MTGTEHHEDGWDRSLSRRGLLAGAAAAAAAGAFPFTLDAATAFAATTPRKGGRLRVAINDGGSTDLLSPYNLPNWASAARAEAAYERLFKVDPLGVPRPRLALSLEPNKTGTVWRCKLRQGVTFHSGKKFTAEDVLYSYRYIANPKNKAEGQPRVSQIDLANSKAISPFEIEFRLKAPIGDFASTVSDKAIWIAPTGKTDFGTKPDGTGPFQFVQWQPGVNSLYKRFENYWGLANGGGPYVDELEFQTIVDDSARLNALLGGQVDEMVFISFLQAKNQASSKAIKVIKADQANCSPITMQIDSKLFKSNDVRVAMKLAIDREQLIKNVTLGFGSVGNDLFGKGLPSYNSALPQRKYDPEKAAGLLKKAGVAQAQPDAADVERLPRHARGRGRVRAAVEEGRDQRHDQADPRGHVLREQPVPEDALLPDVLGTGLRVASTGRPAQELALQRDRLVRCEVGSRASARRRGSSTGPRA